MEGAQSKSPGHSYVLQGGGAEADETAGIRGAEEHDSGLTCLQ